jgi:hypothetical protein
MRAGYRRTHAEEALNRPPQNDFERLLRVLQVADNEN